MSFSVHRFRTLLSLMLFLPVISCSPDSDCQNSDINKFDSFLGVSPETKEVELPEILGATTGGYYAEDNLSFIYTFHSLKDAPITVVVNASTTKVETVLMEVLTFGDDFFTDLEAAKIKYEITECDSRFFGMQKDEITEEFGKPDSEEILEGGVKSIIYNSDDYKTSVNFKFYPEQDNMCSSVIINWF